MTFESVMYKVVHKEEFESHNLPCMIAKKVFNEETMMWCGYVELPDYHPDYGMIHEALAIPTAIPLDYSDNGIFGFFQSIPEQRLPYQRESYRDSAERWTTCIAEFFWIRFGDILQLAHLAKLRGRQ